MAVMDLRWWRQRLLVPRWWLWVGTNMGTIELMRWVAVAALVVGCGGTSDQAAETWGGRVPMDVAGAYVGSDSDVWIVTDDGPAAAPVLRQARALGAHAIVPFSGLLPAAARFERVEVLVDAGGNHGALPERMPQVELIASAWDVGAPAPAPVVVLAIAADPSTSVEQYEGLHVIGADIDAPIEPTTDYYVRLLGELGDNALDGSFTVLSGAALVSR